MNHSEPLLLLPPKQFGLQFECDSNDKFPLSMEYFFGTNTGGVVISYSRD